MERRLGKIQARHPSVNDLSEVSLRDTEGVRTEGTEGARQPCRGG